MRGRGRLVAKPWTLPALLTAVPLGPALDLVQLTCALLRAQATLTPSTRNQPEPQPAGKEVLTESPALALPGTAGDPRCIHPTPTPLDSRGCSVGRAWFDARYVKTLGCAVPRRYVERALQSDTVREAEAGATSPLPF